MCEQQEDWTDLESDDFSQIVDPQEVGFYSDEKLVPNDYDLELFSSDNVDFNRARESLFNLICQIRYNLDGWVQSRQEYQAVLNQTVVGLNLRERRARRNELNDIYVRMVERRTSVYAWCEQILESLTYFEGTILNRNVQFRRVVIQENRKLQNDKEGFGVDLKKLWQETQKKTLTLTQFVELVIMVRRQVLRIMKVFETRKRVNPIDLHLILGQNGRHIPRPNMRGTLDLIEWAKCVHTEHIKSISHMNRLWYIVRPLAWCLDNN
jgi:hypothetical protein